MRFVTKSNVIVYFSIYPVRIKRTTLGIGKIVESGWSRNGYACITSPVKGWVALSLLEKIVDTPPPPVPAGDVWWTKSFVNGKPLGLKPEGVNLGSFAIGWALPEEPEGFINKPAGFNLTLKHIEYIRKFNQQNLGALNWLVDQEGTKDVLSVTAEGLYRCPVPCFSENNPVRVLELTDRFARIQTVSIYDPLPDTLPPYLLHSWYGYTKGGVFFQIQSGLGGVKYPLFARSNSAWVQLAAIQRQT